MFMPHRYIKSGGIVGAQFGQCEFGRSPTDVLLGSSEEGRGRGGISRFVGYIMRLYLYASQLP